MKDKIFGVLQRVGRSFMLPIALLPVAGLLLGAAFLWCLDRVLPHIHMLQDTTEGLSTSWRRSILLVTAMALHHIPEGLAIGVGYGAAGAESMAALGTGAGLTTALVLTFSIMLQNVPEGLVVSAALRSEGFSARKSCFYGVLSGATAPLGAVPGALAAGITAGLLPVALSFAAGAMIYVVIEELVPEMSEGGHSNRATIAFMVGFCLMMTLDVMLG